MPALLRILGAALLALMAQAAQAQTPVRFILDWAPNPLQSPWFLAADRGYFAREGLAVTIDRGFGSGDGMVKVAGGSHDIALGDPNQLPLWNTRNPGSQVRLVFLYMDRGEHAVVTLRGRGITTLPDLAGKRIARTSTGDVTGPLWPLFARSNGIDLSRVEWLPVAPNLRDALLFRGGADAASAFSSTAFFNLRALGAKPEDILLFPFAEHGFELFGNGLLVTTAFAERNPDVLRRFIRATIAGLRDAVADPAAGVAATLRRDPTADPRIEAERFRFTLERSILPGDVRARGMSDIAPDRMARVSGFLAEAYELPPGGPPIYTDAFLPPLAERQFAR